MVAMMTREQCHRVIGDVMSGSHTAAASGLLRAMDKLDLGALNELASEMADLDVGLARQVDALVAALTNERFQR